MNIQNIIKLIIAEYKYSLFLDEYINDPRYIGINYQTKNSKLLENSKNKLYFKKFS